MRGEFIVTTSDGVDHTVPNNITTAGMQQLIRSAFWHTDIDLKMGLCSALPGDIVTTDALQEPEIGVSGYVRQPLPITSIVGTENWPGTGVINGESYVESKSVTFPIAAPLAVPVNRLFLIMSDSVVFSVSSEIFGGLQTLSAPYAARYRLYTH